MDLHHRCSFLVHVWLTFILSQPFDASSLT
jgi:hypothetical protein